MTQENETSNTEVVDMFTEEVEDGKIEPGDFCVVRYTLDGKLSFPHRTGLWRPWSHRICLAEGEQQITNEIQGGTK